MVTKGRQMYQMYGEGTSTNHGLLKDAVSDLIIKGERLGQFQLDYSVTYSEYLGTNSGKLPSRQILGYWRELMIGPIKL